MVAQVDKRDRKRETRLKVLAMYILKQYRKHNILATDHMPCLALKNGSWSNSRTPVEMSECMAAIKASVEVITVVEVS